MRTILCHYHIFKNSGTSFDALLSTNFGDARVVSFDGPFPYFSINQTELVKIIRRHPDAVAFSSHQVRLPAPASLQLRVLPVVFVRNPLLRIHSVYQFRKKERLKSEPSAIEVAFDDWCRSCLDHPQRISQVSNVQTGILGGVWGAPSLSERRTRTLIYDLDQAIRNLRSVDLLARTEFFDRDVERFKDILAREGISWSQTHVEPRNVAGTDFDLSVDERIEALEQSLGAGTLKALLEANEQDLALYDTATRLIEQGTIR